MPLPKPQKGEAKETFISRCIETLTKDDKDKFPSREQRAAVCYSQWGETPQEKAAAARKKQTKTSGKSSGGASKAKK